jgi:catechol 2,3-dioxygenase-like lactoylglutathione lyase family enzyme
VADKPNWQGINHLALVTDDMDATVRFWHQVLGADLVATIGNESFRHYFFRIGDGHTVAFFEYRDVELDSYAKPAGIPYAAAAQFDHLSLNLPDETALEELQRRLKEHGCGVTDVVDHGFVRSIYFMDPNGIALEASCWTLPLEVAHYDDPRRFGDDDPVPAVRELLARGAVDHTPATELVDDIVAR